MLSLLGCLCFTSYMSFSDSIPSIINIKKCDSISLKQLFSWQIEFLDRLVLHQRFMKREPRMLRYLLLRELMVNIYLTKIYFLSIIFGLKCFLWVRLLSVDLTGCLFLAATIFAYGQTSSGKTYTMRGITDHVIEDIFEHMKNVSVLFITAPLFISCLLRKDTFYVFHCACLCRWLNIN